MAGKQSLEGQFREADARDKVFESRYYNAAIHRAALTPPAFFTLKTKP
jgi:spermidine synthase